MANPKLKVAIVQFAPLNVEENINKASKYCSSLRPGSVDLVCLPEMIFTGYDFPGAEAITPYLEEPRTGPTSQFCKSLARRLKCYVVAGYPEALSDEEKGACRDGSSIVGANSAILFDRDGNFLGNYRKVNMYETDKTWAKPGTDFQTFSFDTLPKSLQNVTIGICMDLNPRSSDIWSLQDVPYEIADYCLNVVGKPRTNILVLLNAWLDSKEEPDSRWDLSTLNYWIRRLRPLWDREYKADHSENKEEEEINDTLVVICNRCGQDNDTLFAGTSAILRLRYGSKPDVLGVFGRNEEGVKIFAV